MTEETHASTGVAYLLILMIKGTLLRGVACMIGGSGLLTCNDAVIKWVGANHPVGQMISIRGLYVVAFILLFVHRPGGGGFNSLRIANWGGACLWGAMLVASTFLFLTGLQYLPLADAAALTFAGPLFVVILAPVLLGETVSWSRRIGVFSGFVGVLLILNPSGGAFRWVAILPLSVALVEALRDMLARRMVVQESSLAMVFISSNMVLVSGLMTAPWGWTPLVPMEWGLLALAACFQGCAHFLMVEAFRHGEAASISPFRYTSVLWAVTIGYAVWGDIPDESIIIGGGLLIGSGLYLLRKSRQRQQVADV